MERRERWLFGRFGRVECRLVVDGTQCVVTTESVEGVRGGAEAGEGLDGAGLLAEVFGVAGAVPVVF
jgi:hypothetical protein